MCQVSLGLKEVQMGTHDFKYNNVPLFAQKPGNINTYTIFSKIANITHHLSQELDDIGWL